MSRPLTAPWIVPVALAVLVAGAVPRSAGAYDVATCGPVPDGEVGVLTADVVCASDEAIQLGRGATLRMNGHTVSAEVPASGVGILCENGKCFVEGPGEVFGFRDIGIVALSRSRLDVRDVGVHDNGVGVLGDRVSLSGVTVAASAGYGVIANRLDAVDVTVSGNGDDGINANAARLTDVTVADNARSGLTGRRVKAVRLAVTGNGRVGVQATRPGSVKLVDATITGNGTNDLATEHRPSLKGSTCGTSRRLDANGADGGTWGVCTAD